MKIIPMDSTVIAMIAALVVLVAMSAYFSATETAFSTMNRIRLKSKADAGNRRAALVLEVSKNYDKLLSTILIGNNIVNITATAVATVLFTSLIPVYGPTVATVVLTLIILIFGEISPKSLAKDHAEAFAMFSTPSLRVFITLLTPLNYFFSLLKKLLNKLFQGSGDAGITEEELITMVSEAENEGGLDQHESQLIRAAIEFNDLEVNEILTPRVDIVGAEDTATMDEIAAIFAENGYSRLPIYHDSIDNIIGVIHEKDFHAARYHGQTDVRAITSNVLYTTASTKISELMRILQRAKAHMVIVVDEYGGTEGLCTLEDIVEELVGEIWDEHDEVIEEFKKQGDGSYIISCNANLTDLYDLFSLKGGSDSATVSGWVMDALGRIPEEGDRFLYENLDVTVVKVDHRRVMEICVIVVPEEAT